LVFNIYNSN